MNVNFLKIVLAFVIIFVFSLFAYSIYNGKVHISHLDEISYFNGAKLFYETGSLKAAYCVEGERSAIGEFSWYGPAYHLIYGGIAKIFGFHPINFFVFNFFLYVISLFILSRFNLPVKEKLVLLISFGISGPLINYMFTFYPVVLHIFMGVVLTFILFRFDVNSSYKFLYIIAVFIFTLVHITFVFWAFALIPFSKNKKEFYLNIIIIISLFAIALLYMKLFMAPAQVSNLRGIFSLNIAGLIVGILKNALWNFSFIYNGLNYFQALIIIFAMFALYLFLINSPKKIINIGKIIFEDKLLIASIIISFSILFVMIALYECKSFFLIRQTAFLIPLLLSALIIHIKKYRYFILLLLLFSLPGIFSEVYSTISDNKRSYFESFGNENRNSCVEQIKYIEGSKNINIFVDTKIFDLPNMIDISVLPNSNINGIPILYSTYGRHGTFENSLNKMLGNKYPDYIISKNRVEINNYGILMENNYFFLYGFKK